MVKFSELMTAHTSFRHGKGCMDRDVTHVSEFPADSSKQRCLNVQVHMTSH